jgi:arabinofuranosyltransferase
MIGTNRSSDNHYSVLWLSLGILFFLVLLLRVSWLNDDAYITFRVIANLVNGYGPVYNIGERVQAFTHPLWMFILATAYFLFFKLPGISFPGGLPLITLVLSWVCTTLAVALITYRKTERSLLAIIAIWILLNSKAFMDFGASGLENPLTYLLLAIFLVHYRRALSDQNHTRLFWLALIAGIATLNRMDTVLFFIPALTVTWWKTSKRVRGLGIVILGFLPFILWEIFSFTYYGFPFPNTAYAKLNSGIPAASYFQQGLLYLLNSISLDPLSICLISITTLLAVWKWDKKQTPIAIGIILYLIYVIRIGGDYMSGRYLSTLVFASVLILVHFELSWERLYAPTFFVVLLLGVVSQSLPFITDSTYENVFFDPNGISDERGFRYQEWGLLRISRNQLLPDSPYLQGDWIWSGKEDVVESGAIGLQGYRLGPNVHILDVMALTDPLLARLPAKDQDHWRVGHIERDVPKGYRETLKTGENLIEDPGLRSYYDQLQLAIKGPVFHSSRWQAIWSLNLGWLNHDLETYSLETSEG